MSSTFKLLGTSNYKTVKGEKKGYRTYNLNLAPSDLSGVMNTCPMATAGCRAACLNTAGHGGMFREGETIENNTNNVQVARKRKTVLFKSDRITFMAMLVADIRKAIKQSEKANMIPVFRLNNTSDISWEKIPVVDNGIVYDNIFQLFDSVQFYDYTKIPNRKIGGINNYHLTFSKADGNDKEVAMAMQNGYNVAVVFNRVPTEYMGLEVIDGDESDLRFLDPHGVIVGLKAKGRARKDTSGFVVHV